MSGQSKKLLSIVVPVLNEESNVEPFYDRVVSVLSRLSDRFDYELIFTDNHSSDATFEKLQALATQDSCIRVIRFSRNFGYQRSLLTGYTYATGDAAVQLDCDLQDPPELIPEFVRKWEQGYQVVYGIRTERQESRWMSITRKFFYRLIDFLSEDHLPHDAGDFRLVDRRVLDELKKIDDSQPYIRGTLATLGFNQIGIPYNRSKRLSGDSKFSLTALVGLAIDGILNHSIVPLRLSTYLGLIISLTMFLGVITYVVGKFLFGQNWPPGFATLIIMILGSLSLNALFLGIIGEYLGRIYRQVKRRPMTIVERVINPLATRPENTEDSHLVARNR
jgi:glycosyltransferase involved in cell wall biosynthesis